VGIGGEENMKKSFIQQSVIAALSFTSVNSFAELQTEKLPELLTETILVTATRSEQDSFLALSANQIISREDIENMQVVSVAEILKTVAGIHVTNQGSAGQLTSVFTRGTNSNHTLVLVDGVRIGSATTGTSNLAAISPQQIERIEIVKGVRAALWGSDAIGGVIQIFTKKFANGEGALTAAVGSNGYHMQSASIGFGNEQHLYSISATREKEQGFNAYQSDPNNPYDINEPDNDGYQRESLSLKGTSHFTQQLSLSLVGRYEKTDSEYDASYPDQPCWYDANVLCPSFYANSQLSENYLINTRLKYLTENSEYNFSLAKSRDQGERYGNGVASETITSEREQLTINGIFSLTEFSQLTVGGDWYQEYIATDYDMSAWTPGVQSYDVMERDVLAGYAHLSHQQNNWLLESALRYDDIEHVDAELTYNASIGYQLSDNWLVGLNTGTGFKAPSFNDLYWPGSGNSELMAETSTSHELLLRRKGAVALELSIFNTEVEDLIAWAPNEFGLWQPANVDNAEMTGADVSINFQSHGLDHNVAFAYVDTEDKLTGGALLRRPHFTADYAIQYASNQWQIGSTLSYRSKSYDSGKVELEDYWLVGFTFAYHVTEQLSVKMKLANVFDQHYQTTLNYQADKSNYRASVSYNF
jgi:vitamin B12 transporter